jgi:chromosome partitioning protein
MPVIVVANPKGGVGKSTLATNLAGWFAHRGHAVMLGDTDRQHSSRRWLELRPTQLPAIRGWDIAGTDTVRVPRGTSHVVLDTPAGILVPLQPSLFDIQATHDFVQGLRAHKHGADVEIAIVGNRAREGTISLDQLRHFLVALGVPVLGYLRDTQNYVQLAARGLTLWDTAPSRVERDLEQWQAVLGWTGR